MAWIESHQSLANHRKTKDFKRLLGIKTPQAIGHLHLLWWWALDNAPDGNLNGINPSDLADVAEWRGDPEKFVNALKTAGFIDEDLCLHNWYEYAGKLVEKREQATSQRRAAGSARMSRLSPQGRHDLATKASQARWQAQNASDMPASMPATVPTQPTQPTQPLPLIAPFEEKVEESHKKTVTTETELLEFVEETKSQYPDLDCEVEFRKFQTYWSECGRKLKLPKTAWLNWLDKARQISNERGNERLSKSSQTNKLINSHQADPDRFTSGKFGGIVQR